MARLSWCLLALLPLACRTQAGTDSGAAQLPKELAAAGADSVPLPGTQSSPGEDAAGTAAERSAGSVDLAGNSVPALAAGSVRPLSSASAGDGEVAAFAQSAPAGSPAGSAGAAESIRTAADPPTALAEDLTPQEDGQGQEVADGKAEPPRRPHPPGFQSTAADPPIALAEFSTPQEDGQGQEVQDGKAEQPRRSHPPGFQRAAKVQTVTRKLGAGDAWHPTAFLYLRGPRDWQHRAFVGLRSGAVASIALADGSVEWSNVPNNPQGAVQTLYQKHGVLVTASDSGTVQGWEVATGTLKWETACPSHVFQSVLDIGGIHDGFGLVCRQQIEYRTLSGDRLWTTKAPGMATLRAAAAVDNLRSICVLSLGSAGTHALRIDAESGVVTETFAVPAQVGAALALPTGITAGDYFVYPAGDRLHAYPICGEGNSSDSDGRRSFESQPLEGLNSTGILLRPVQDTPGWFTLDGTNGTAVYALAGVGITKIFMENVTALVGPVHGALHGETGKRLAVAAPRKEGYEVRVRHAHFGRQEAMPSTAGAYSLGQHGDVERVLVQQLVDRSFRAVVYTVKGSLLAIERSKVVWARTRLDVGKVEL